MDERLRRAFEERQKAKEHKLKPKEVEIPRVPQYLLDLRDLADEVFEECKDIVRGTFAETPDFKRKYYEYGFYRANDSRDHENRVEFFKSIPTPSVRLNNIFKGALSAPAFFRIVIGVDPKEKNLYIYSSRFARGTKKVWGRHHLTGEREYKKVKISGWGRSSPVRRAKTKDEAITAFCDELLDSIGSDLNVDIDWDNAPSND